MLIDRKHLPWAIATAGVAALSVAVYLWDAPRHLTGPGGSTWVGLTFGVAALLMMLYCVALGLRRRVPHWSLGAARTWMRGHIWLGLLSGLMVALHSAFSFGGPMTTALWTLTILVIASGVTGLVLQQFVPSLLLGVKGEALWQQWKREYGDLTRLAAETVVEFAGSLDTPAPEWPPPPEPPQPEPAEGEAKPAPKRKVDPNSPPLGGEPLRLFYLQYVANYFDQGVEKMATTDKRSALFHDLRALCPQHIHPGIDRLRMLCERKPELLRQRTLMRVLIWWLLVHVPLSWMLIVLSVTHAFVALRY